MLKGISPLISPALLKILSEMGHGDEIVLADANFPSENYGQRCIRADGIGATALLEGILPLFPLDQYDADHFVLMQVTPGDPYVPEVWADFETVLKQHEQDSAPSHMGRFDFYERTKRAYAVVATGEKALYANIILKKGVIK